LDVRCHARSLARELREPPEHLTHVDHGIAFDLTTGVRNVFVSACLLLAAPLYAGDLVPLTDLGNQPYAYGYFGGLYENGSNTVPADHLAAGLKRAAMIVPRDVAGNPSPDGKVVLLAAGFGETRRIMCGAFETCDDGSLMAMARRDARVNHDSLVIVNAASEGADTTAWVAPPYGTANFGRIRDSVLAPAGVTAAQVQAAWVQMMTANPETPLPPPYSDTYRLKGSIAAILRELKTNYPNLQIAYLSSRVYGGYSTSKWNPEPFAYESGLSVRWDVMGQITEIRDGFLWDTRIATLNYVKGIAPWAAWGPYLWADGSNPRADGLAWMRDDFDANGESLTPPGAHKAAQLLLDFLLTEPTAKSWFRSNAPPPPARLRAVRH
jgi:hypothetical protein